MQRDEKQLDASLEILMQRVQEVRNDISSFLWKLEHEYEILNWPTMLDSFALLTGQINSLVRLIKNEKLPLLRNHLLLPLIVSTERDAELEKLTESRVMSFNPSLVPDYLRTKHDLEIEEKVNQCLMRSNTIPQEQLQKQKNNVDKIVCNTCEMIGSSRDSTEHEINQKTAPAQTSLQPDTNSLIAAISFGKNLKPVRQSRGDPGPHGGMHPGGMPGQHPHQQGMAGPAGMQQQHPPPGGGNLHVNKAQSGMKSNIRQGMGHPYGRP